MCFPTFLPHVSESSASDWKLRIGQFENRAVVQVHRLAERRRQSNSSIVSPSSAKMAVVVTPMFVMYLRRLSAAPAEENSACKDGSMGEAGRAREQREIQGAAGIAKTTARRLL